MEYDRKILVPYLTELYGAEVTYHALNNKALQYSKIVEYEKHNINNSHKLNTYIQKPNKKLINRKSALITLLLVSLPISIIVCFIISHISVTKFIIQLIIKIFSDLAFVIFPFAFIFLWFGIAALIAPFLDKEINQRDSQMKQYNINTSTLEKEKAAIRYAQQNLPQHKKILEEILSELNKCKNILVHAYDLNIIPVQYRNLGSIAYLYEYFSTSQATNLDQVIQSMLLDDVRQRIQNIENKLNQIISNQQRTYEKLSEIQ